MSDDELLREPRFNGWQGLASLFGKAPHLRSGGSKLPVHPLQAFGYQYATRLLALLVNRGLLDARQVQTICDFGAGTGGPSLALRDFFKCATPHLTVLESYAPQACMLQTILPEATIAEGDGLAWLSRQAQKQDLITAFMLGPDDEYHQLATDLMDRAIPCLKPQGTLLICSDVATMHGVLRIAKKRTELGCDWIVPEDTEMLPVTVLISRGKHQTAGHGYETMVLPEPIIEKRMVPDAQHCWEPEEYCLSNAFEKAYLQATIDAFIFQSPEHPAIPVMQALLRPA